MTIRMLYILVYHYESVLGRSLSFFDINKHKPVLFTIITKFRLKPLAKFISFFLPLY
jgi:hypothetical protein